MNKKIENKKVSKNLKTEAVKTEKVEKVSTFKKKNLVKDLNGEMNIESIQSEISGYLTVIEG